MAHLNEQLQQEQSRKELELKETRDTHQSQITSLQEKITTLVSIVGHSQKAVFENCLSNTWFIISHPSYSSVYCSHWLIKKKTCTEML